MSGWPIKRLSEVADLCLGKMLDQKKNKGELRPYLGNSDVQWGTINLEKLKEMKFEDRELGRYGLQAGDIIMCEGGEPGRCALWTGQVPTMMIQKALHRIRPLSGVDSRFLFYSLFHKGRSGGFDARFTGATIKHLPGEQLAKIEVALPAYEIQRRITGILGAYDDLIEVNRRRAKLQKEIARDLFDEWFVRLRFPGHEDVPLIATPEGSLPKGWRRASIGETFDNLYDGPHATPPPSDSGGVFLGIGNITTTGQLDLTSVRRIAEADLGRWTKRVTPARGDIVFTYEATLNRYAIIPEEFRGCLGRRLALIRTSYPGMNYYLFQYFFTEDWRSTIATNTLSGATVDRIPLTRFSDFPITLPPLHLVERFGRIVQPVFALKERLDVANRNLAASRDHLLTRLMSGQLSVSAAEQELEAA